MINYAKETVSRKNLMKLLPEIHLFVIWENARYLQDEILADIAKHFTILKQYEITWTPSLAASNIVRFCGTRLGTNLKYKITDCGIGEFLVVVIRDENPIYEERNTFHGTVAVNVNMFEAKQRYRQWTGGGIKIHASDNPIETSHDLALLLGISVNDFAEMSLQSETEKLQKDLEGTGGWRSLRQLSFVVKQTASYVNTVEPDDIWLILNMFFTYKVIRKLKKETTKLIDRMRGK